MAHSLCKFWKLLNSVLIGIMISMLAIAVNFPLIYLDSALVPFAKPKKKKNNNNNLSKDV